MRDDENRATGKIRITGGSIKPYSRAKDQFFARVFYVDENGTRRQKGKVLKTSRKKEAEEMLSAWRSELMRELNGVDARDALEIPTVSAWVELCLDRIIKSGSIEKSTIGGYRANNNHIKERMGHLLLDEVTQGTVQDTINALVDSGLSPVTVKKVYTRLKYYLDQAVEEGILTRNPCKNVRLPKPSQPKRNAMSKEGRAQLISMLGAMEDSPVVIGSLLALYTGARQGEICALTWADVDFTDDGTAFVNVRRSIGKDENGGFYLKDMPKTQSGIRKIPLADRELVERLKRVRARHVEQCMYAGTKIGARYVIGNIDGSFLKPETLMKRFRAFADAVGLKNQDGERLQFHELRHTFATECLAQGVDVETVSKMLGHASAKLTLDIYGHARPEMKMEAAQKIADAFTVKPTQEIVIPFPKTSAGGE